MALALTCRFCNSFNCKALGENTMCCDCGRLAEGILKLVEVPDPEPVTPVALPDVTAADTTPDPALTAAVEAALAGPSVNEASESEPEPEPEPEGEDDVAAALSAIDEAAFEPLPEDSPLKP